jgi:hypothetical protein
MPSPLPKPAPRAAFLSCAALAACAALAGCAAANTTTPVSAQLPPLPTGTYANWQFQTGTALSSSGVLFLAGPLQMSNGVVSGQMNSTAPCSQTEPRVFAGTLNATTGALTLSTTTPGLSGRFTLNASLTSASTGTLAGGAMGYSTGVACEIVAQGAAIGVQIPTLTGAYSGTVSSSTGATGTAILTLTQSTTPNTQAAFPLTATLQYTSSACSATYTLTGSISGAPYTLAAAATSGVTVTGLDSNNGLTLPAVTIVLPSGSCASAGTFTGTFTQ